MKPDKAYVKLLVRDIVDNDNEASFSILFKLFYESLTEFSRYYVDHKEVAEEIVSDVFVSVWNNRQRLHAVASMEAYLYVSVKNRSLNYLKSNQRAMSAVEVGIDELDLSDFLDAFDPERELELQELQYSIRVAIDSLSPQCKTIFKLIREDGFSYKQVAEILEISVRTVETQLIRALKRLDAALAPFITQKTKAGKSKPSLFKRLNTFLLSLTFSL